MTICLNMIVKNEAAVIARCLASVRPFIDSWAILDTGSTDGTQEIIQRELEGIPGILQEGPWTNFADARNRALCLVAGAADYILFIDADEEWRGVPPKRLEGEAIDVGVHYGTTRYARVALVKNLPAWRWIGPVHEYLELGREPSRGVLFGSWIHVYTDGARSKDPDKFLKDAKLLEEALEGDPDNTRNVFYLAQSYRDAGLPLIAKSIYERRAHMGGWEEEVYIALLNVARCSERGGLACLPTIDEYLHAFCYRPSRTEALYDAARIYRQRGMYAIADLLEDVAGRMPATLDRLFVEVHE